MNFVFSASKALIPNYGLHTGYTVKACIGWSVLLVLRANWLQHCLLVPVPSVAVLQRCSAQLLITGDSLQYADLMGGDVGYLRRCG